jgi:acetylornithine/succinyldiaminopimelate/putrescine aminotransferase
MPPELSPPLIIEEEQIGQTLDSIRRALQLMK